MPAPPNPESVEQLWRQYLTTGDVRLHHPLFMKHHSLHRLLRRLPADPRCRLCYAPFNGFGGTLVRVMLDRGPSRLNPQICNTCEAFARDHRGGAEVELSMVFVDVRGSTGLAEGMSASVFSQLIDRFYTVSTAVFFDAGAMVEKMIGDQVTALFVPGMAGPAHARVAVNAARAVLAATGHGEAAGPWVPVGAGVHTGVAFVGSIGVESGVADIAALGDAVNVGARLAAQAEAGEIVISDATRAAAGLDTSVLDRRELTLKGRQEPVITWRIGGGERPGAGP